MIAADVFVFGLAMSVQGIAASLLPRRHFLRMSSFLQMGSFSLIVGVYFLHSMMVRPAIIVGAQQRGMLGSSPSYSARFDGSRSNRTSRLRWPACDGCRPSATRARPLSCSSASGHCSAAHRTVSFSRFIG